MITIERRNLFSKIFGDKKQVPTYKRFELISSSNTAFYAWDGQIFDNDLVRSAIRPKANAVGKLNAKHIRGYGKDMVINPDPVLRDLLQFPNPYMSMQDFLMKMTFQRELNHNAFAYIKRNAVTLVPEAIYPMPASSVELTDVNGEMYARFRFRTGKSVVVPYEDVIHLRKDFNSDDIFGDSGAKALKPLMEVITATDQGVVNAIKNSAIIRWILKFKSILQPADRDLQVKEFVKNYLAITNEGGAAASDPRYDIEQVKQDGLYVPNAAQMKEIVQRLYKYFGVNDSIVSNKFTEDEWNSFYESEIEPILLQLANAFTRAFFSTGKRSFGNRIAFDSSSLAYASMATKLNLLQMVDRGALTPNEWREIMNLSPVEGGDKPIRRLDTVPVSDATKTEGEGGSANQNNPE